MRLFFACLLASLVFASPVMASDSQVSDLIAPLTAHTQEVGRVSVDSSSPEYQATRAGEKRFERCVKTFKKSPKVKKKLKTKQGRAFAEDMFSLALNESISIGYNVYGPRINQTADQLDALGLSDQVLLDTAKAGASLLRSSTEFFRESGKDSMGCRFLSRVSRVRKWSRKNLRDAYNASLPRTTSEQQALTDQMDSAQQVLVTGSQHLGHLGATDEQIKTFDMFFSLDVAEPASVKTAALP